MKNPPCQSARRVSENLLGNSKSSLAVFYVEQVALNRHVSPQLQLYYLCLSRLQMSRGTIGSGESGHRAKLEARPGKCSRGQLRGGARKDGEALFGFEGAASRQVPEMLGAGGTVLRPYIEVASFALI
jgi:hypothetical protein